MQTDLMTIDRYKSRRVTVNMPEDLYVRISKSAEEDTRTVSQQIVRLCIEAFNQRDKETEGK